MGTCPEVYSNTRTTPLRYLGYAPMVSCTLRPMLPCSMGYYMGKMSHLRTFYIGMDVFQNAYPQTGCGKAGIPNKLIALTDVLLWQGLASGFIPAAILHESKALMTRYIPIPYVPHILALALIPVIIPPIDAATQLLMNMTYRNVMGPTY